MMGKIKKIVGAFVHAPDRFDDLAGRIADVNHQNDVTRALMDEKERELLRRVDGLNISWFMDQLCDDRTLLSRLNRGLTISPTVWGDPGRLEIDETAAVFTCFFNVNSGRIRIGESTFAGSGVSILAGGHDPRLTGFLRKDAEYTEGCDIEIGRGVWLASGCTLLGPCRVGDNAVIAAGAVVTPGTEVPEGTVWGGVPARQIGQLDGSPMTPDNPAVVRAFERSEGILFTDGWGEKIPGVFSHPGHWMCKQKAGFITDRAEWILEYRREGAGGDRIRMTGPGGEATAVLSGSEGTVPLRLPVEDGKLAAVGLVRESREKIFMSLTPAPSEVRTETAGAESAVQAEDDADAVDIEAVMEEIREEARKLGPYDDLPGFETISREERGKGAKLRSRVRTLTEDFVIPTNYADPSRNPLKRIYKKIMVRAANCVTAPIAVRVTETNRNLKTALEKAAEVIEEQERRIEALEEAIRDRKNS